MKKAVVLAATVLSLAGCTTIRNQPIDQKASEAIKGQTVTYAKRDAKPDFVAMTAGKAAFALVGAALMISEGNQIISSNDVPDPAVSIASELAQALEGTHQVKVMSAVTVNGDAADLSASTAGAKYVIDVETINWLFAYFPTDWTHYRVLYTGKARLIDTSTKQVVAEGACSRNPEQAAGAPTYDELLADNAKRLKSELATAASECVALLKRDMLKL